MTPDELKKKFNNMQRNAPRVAREQAILASQRAISTVSAPNMAGYTVPTLNGSKAVFKPVIGSKVDAKVTSSVKKQLRNNLADESKVISKNITQRITK